MMNFTSAPSRATSSIGMTVPSTVRDSPSECLSSQSMTSLTLMFGSGISSPSSMPHRRMSASSALACFCSSAWK
ncbi:unannotated protein [freshwater metagenome]|uniref:Unannotated protein n=1 Tax=freshwater metagenome TaxID=449393 RepID=A0A6J7HLI4_9ZZZZ